MAVFDVRISSPVSLCSALLHGADSPQSAGDTHHRLLVVAGVLRPVTPGGPGRAGQDVVGEVGARPWNPRGARVVVLSRWTAEPRSGLRDKRQERLGENVRI